MKLYDGDTFELDGFNFRVKFEHDSDMRYPWDECDGHGVVRRSNSRHAEGYSDKKPSERPLNQAGRNEYQFYYDWAASLKKAKHEKWDAAPYGKPDGYLRAVEQDFEYLRAYIAGDWEYVGVIVEMLDDDGETIREKSIWGVETWRDYHCEMAQDIARELVGEQLDEDQANDREAIERSYWQSRDVMTLEGSC